MPRQRFMRWFHLMWRLVLLLRGDLPHQAITITSRLRTLYVGCTCGREWS